MIKEYQFALIDQSISIVGSEGHQFGNLFLPSKYVHLESLAALQKRRVILDLWKSNPDFSLKIKALVQVTGCPLNALLIPVVGQSEAHDGLWVHPILALAFSEKLTIDIKLFFQTIIEDELFNNLHRDWEKTLQDLRSQWEDSHKPYQASLVTLTIACLDWCKLMKQLPTDTNDVLGLIEYQMYFLLWGRSKAEIASLFKTTSFEVSKYFSPRQLAKLTGYQLKIAEVLPKQSDLYQAISLAKIKKELFTSFNLS